MRGQDGGNVQRPVFLILLLYHPFIAYSMYVLSLYYFAVLKWSKFVLLALAVSHCWLKIRGSQLLNLQLSSNSEDLD